MKFWQVARTIVTRTLPAEAASICEAAAVLRGGGLVAFPTETVYGLGADALNEAAVREMFAAKGRPPDHPVIVHLADASLVGEYAAEVPETAQKLAAAFWPGPMTLVLRRSARVSDLVTGGLETVGIRVPGHPVARALLCEFGGPIAAPSANRFGRVSCTSARHVAEELAGRVALILDGGDCPVGIESTIIDVTGEQPAILRPGKVTAEQVSALLGMELGRPAKGGPRVSGSLASHYAPRATVELVAEERLLARAEELAAEGKKVALITRQGPASCPAGVVVLRAPDEEQALARELYSLLRRVDELGCNVAVTALPLGAGLEAAIADRLRRAAGPRSI